MEITNHKTNHAKRYHPSNKLFIIKLTKLLQNGVSWRELQCLTLWIFGFTMLEIGKQLHISVRTVETHLCNIREKLNMRTKQELIKYCLQEEIYDEFILIAKHIVGMH